MWFHIACDPSVAVRRMVTNCYTYGNGAFPVAAVRVWNSIPQHVVSASSLSVFFCSRHIFFSLLLIIYVPCLRSDTVILDTLIVCTYTPTYLPICFKFWLHEVHCRGSSSTSTLEWGQWGAGISKEQSPENFCRSCVQICSFWDKNQHIITKC